MDETREIPQDELEAEGVEELPAREAMSVITPFGDDLAQPPELEPLKGGEGL